MEETVEIVLRECADNHAALELCKLYKELRTKCERLEQEAVIQAQEMRTQRSIVRECYEAVTGKTGEPGDWNGAEPVKKALNELRAENAKLRDDNEQLRMKLDKLHPLDVAHEKALAAMKQWKDVAAHEASEETNDD